MTVLPAQLSNQTSLQRVSQIRSSMAVDGTMRYIDMGATSYYRIDCVVEVLTHAERDTLIDWLEDNETLDIDVVLRTGGPTYRGQLFYDEDIAWEAQDGGLYTVTFALWAVKL